MNNKKVFDSEFNGEMFWRRWNARAYFSINMRKSEKDICKYRKYDNRYLEYGFTCVEVK